MFGFSKKTPSGKLSVMGHGVEVISISRNGKVLYTSDTAKAYPKNHMEGQIIEISFGTRSGNPYFVYYICSDYYFATVGPAGAASFGGAGKTEEFRSTVSKQVVGFLVEYLQQEHRIDARQDITSFSHNRAHTNVLSYVSSLNDWYAIQHNDSESDNASIQKVGRVNSRNAKITDFIAIDYPSPSEAD